MSTRVGTLQGSQTGRSIWPAAILASLVMLTIAVGAISLGRDRPQPTTKTSVGGIEQTFVGGTAANTPSELRGGLAESNGRGGVRLTPHVPRRAAEATGSFAGGTVGNAPAFIDTTVRDEPIMVNGHICGQCG